jgi:acyl phosphate:glycerol-3-phosphate acyltransferase
MTLVLAALLAFLLGSIPFGLVLTKAAGLGDIRNIGSGNIGATNVLRTGKKGLAIATLLLDGGKGALAVLVAERFGTEAAVVAGAASVLGHMFTPWLAFKGGKGVATAGGVLLALAWPVGLLGIATWLAVAFATRYSSLAALVAAAAVPVYAWFLTERLRALLILFLAVIVLARHHENIRRLLRGEESKIKLGSGA